MSKVVISNRIYMPLPADKKALFDALTYTISNGKEGTSYFQVETVRNYKMITPQIVSIPPLREDLIPKGLELVDKRIDDLVEFPDPKLPLFEQQKVVYDKIEGSCIINALVGWGKTFFGLHLARKLGCKTLVIVHTAALRDQWIGEVEKLYGFTPGIIAAGKCELDTPIVIGNVQSVVKVLSKIEKVFGTVIVDEMHHTPATTFTSIINAMHARFRVGLSGTLKRQDGKHILFKDYFGTEVHQPPQNNTLAPTIKILKSKMVLPAGSTWAQKITNLLSDTEYIEMITSLALVQANRGHKVLVIADRTRFLEKVAELVGERAVVVIGGTKNREEEIEKINSTADIICGSRQIFSEGISANALSCVILAVPISSESLLEQIIGRIMRLYEGKLPPEVIDIQFSGFSIKKQNMDRIGLYMRKGWDIIAL